MIREDEPEEVLDLNVQPDPHQVPFSVFLNIILGELLDGINNRQQVRERIHHNEKTLSEATIFQSLQEKVEKDHYDHIEMTPLTHNVSLRLRFPMFIIFWIRFLIRNIFILLPFQPKFLNDEESDMHNKMTLTLFKALQGF